jgi:hypothetical protein
MLRRASSLAVIRWDRYAPTALLFERALMTLAGRVSPLLPSDRACRSLR